VAFRLANDVGTHDFSSITGLNPFTLARCGPSPPCVRFAADVTAYGATRSTQYLAKASGAGTCLRLAKPSFARRTSKWPKMGFFARSPEAVHYAIGVPCTVEYPIL
jgi:hypothetical protein